MTVVARKALLWICAACQQQLPSHDSRCDCAGLHSNRYFVSPLGLIPLPERQERAA